MRRGERLQSRRFAASPAPDSEGVTEPRPCPGLCIGDRPNTGTRPSPAEAVPRAAARFHLHSRL